ncbi:MAG TPA: hypothetical protein VFQ22_07990 [Longimicrobiales bacterium]|nr:hypothetical protein [Longimicrobiales bacterium]
MTAAARAPYVLGSPEITARFDRICTQLGARRRGLTLQGLAGAHALARELEAGAPDGDRAETLARELGLGRAALAHLENAAPRSQLELGELGTTLQTGGSGAVRGSVWAGGLGNPRVSSRSTAALRAPGGRR